jgi:hypothetical protein
MLGMKTMSTVVVAQAMQLMKSTGTRISSKSSVPDVYYHLIDASVYLIAAAIPIYFILKSRKSIDNNNNHLLKLTIVLVGFILRFYTTLQE